MADYSNFQALAVRLVTEYGFPAVVRGADVPSDPVTGASGASGVERTVDAFQASMDLKLFPETMIEAGDRMMIFTGEVFPGEKLIHEGEWSIRQSMQIKPDASSHIISKALVSG